MTDIIALTEQQHKRIEWQNVPYDVTIDDMCVFITRAIEHLYVVTGRALMFREDMFTTENGLYVTFSETLPLDEKWYVLLTAEIDFYTKVQTGVSDLTSYTTDAMSVSHGDKPFANLQQKLMDLDTERKMIWYKMTRYHHL